MSDKRELGLRMGAQLGQVCSYALGFLVAGALTGLPLKSIF
jgi:hypothetical protein